MNTQLDIAITKVREKLERNPLGLTIGQLQTLCKLSNKTVKDALAKLHVECDAAGVVVLPVPKTDEYITEYAPSNHIAKKTFSESEPKPQESASKPKNKPFTPNPTRGYEVQKGKVKIFLDRKASSKVLTLGINDLRELLRAVEKSEAVT